MGCPFCVPYIQVKSEFGIQWTCFIFQIRKSFKYLKCEHMPSCSVFFLKGGVKSKKKALLSTFENQYHRDTSILHSAKLRLIQLIVR